MLTVLIFKKMNVLKPSDLTPDILSTGQSGVPLVICSEAPRGRKRIESAGYQEVKINKELSKRLLDIPKLKGLDLYKKYLNKESLIKQGIELEVYSK